MRGLLDADLLERARAGDRDAIEAVLVHEGPRALRFARRMCASPSDADDALQDALVAAVRELPRYEGRGSFASWLFTLVRTACVRRHRGPKNAAPEPLTELATDETPEDALARTELRDVLASALDALSPEHREVLMLRDVEGLPASEVAAVLALEEGAVKSRLHRARRALRAEVEARLAPPRAPSPAASCPDVFERFSRKLEGELATTDCAAMEAHLATCARCRDACDELRHVLGACSALGREPVPPALHARLRAIAARALG